MQTTFIIGIDSVAGATLERVWSAQHQQQILAWPLSSAAKRSQFSNSSNQYSLSQLLATHQPDQVIFCGTAARSNWDLQHDAQAADKLSAEAKLLNNWLVAADEFDSQFVFLSSDAVFTGPWMFHAEVSQNFCSSRVAQHILEQEQLVQSHSRNALIVRSHLVGFAPDGTSWLDSLLEDLELQNAITHNATAYATPILAADFAEFLADLLPHQDRGLIHIAGAERVSPAQFTCRLADHFDQAKPIFIERSEIEVLQTEGSAPRETSLNSGKLRKILGCGTPLLHEALNKLAQQKCAGFDKQIRATHALLASKVA